MIRYFSQHSAEMSDGEIVDSGAWIPAHKEESEKKLRLFYIIIQVGGRARLKMHGRATLLLENGIFCSSLNCVSSVPLF